MIFFQSSKHIQIENGKSSFTSSYNIKISLQTLVNFSPLEWPSSHQCLHVPPRRHGHCKIRNRERIEISFEQNAFLSHPRHSEETWKPDLDCVENYQHCIPSTFLNTSLESWVLEGSRPFFEDFELVAPMNFWNMHQ